jgi:hypothetical protein
MTDNVQGFDTMDEMFAAMAASEDAANRDLLPGQIRLRDTVNTPGYWVRAIPSEDVVIYGKAETQGALTVAGVGFDVVDNRERGYLTGKAFSAWEPEGEYGDTHVSQVIPIGVHEFTLAEAFGWPTFSGLRANDDHRILLRALADADRAARV